MTGTYFHSNLKYLFEIRESEVWAVYGASCRFYHPQGLTSLSLKKGIQRARQRFRLPPQISPSKNRSPAKRLNFNLHAPVDVRIQNTEPLQAPMVTKHYKRRKEVSSLPERRYTAPPNQAGLQLKSVLGYNGNGRKNMVWKYDTGNCKVKTFKLIMMRLWTDNFSLACGLAIENTHSCFNKCSRNHNYSVKESVCWKYYFVFSTSFAQRFWSKNREWSIFYCDFSFRCLRNWKWVWLFVLIQPIMSLICYVYYCCRRSLNCLIFRFFEGLFAYTSGCIVVIEDLHTGTQRHLLGHTEEISTLALQHDGLILASASGPSDIGASQICLWNLQSGICKKVWSWKFWKSVFSRLRCACLTPVDITRPS